MTKKTVYGPFTSRAQSLPDTRQGYYTTQVRGTGKPGARKTKYTENAYVSGRTQTFLCCLISTRASGRNHP